MKWIHFENFKNSSIYITPNLPIVTTKRYKFSLLRITAYITIYTLAAWLFLVLILSITPLKDFVFVVDNAELQIHKQKVEQLQQKVILLSEQLQTVASTNEKIRYALKLAKSDSIKSNDPIYDTLKKPVTKKLKIGGDILAGFNMLLSKIFGQETQTKSLIFIEPTHGISTQEFNPTKGHMGIDYGVKSGSPVFASAGGLVTFSDYTVDSGFMIIIQHDQDYITIYKHCASLLKKVRDVVSQGELIALSGNSGKNTTGAHLHFEIWQKGKPIDPQKILIK